MKFFLEPIFLVFIGSKLLFFLFYERIRFLFFESILIDALLHCFFMRWLINLTYWMEFYIVVFVFSPLLSPFRLSTSFFFASQLRIRFIFLLFMQKRFQLLQWYDRYIISWLVFWIQIMWSDELVISSIVIVICLYKKAGLFFSLILTLKNQRVAH
jgi:hypothetical protein